MQNERGGPILEFAIILPVVSVFLFGIIQYSLVLMAFISLRSATAAAARYAVLDPSSGPANTADIANYARGVLSGSMVGYDSQRLDAPTVNWKGATVGTVGGATSVSLTYHFPVFFPIPGARVGGNFDISATTVMK